MPAFWSQLGVDYTNAREDVRGESDSYAFTDAMVLGYALRWVESERADGGASLTTLLFNLKTSVKTSRDARSKSW